VDCRPITRAGSTLDYRFFLPDRGLRGACFFRCKLSRSQASRSLPANSVFPRADEVSRPPRQFFSVAARQLGFATMGCPNRQAALLVGLSMRCVYWGCYTHRVRHLQTIGSSARRRPGPPFRWRISATELRQRPADPPVESWTRFLISNCLSRASFAHPGVSAFLANRRRACLLPLCLARWLGIARIVQRQPNTSSCRRSAPKLYGLAHIVGGLDGRQREKKKSMR